MNFSNTGLKYLENLEGKKYEGYLDTGNKLTIGIGHLVTRYERVTKQIPALSENGVKYLVPLGILNDSQVYDILRKDTFKTVSSINQEVIVPLKQNQFDSLVCFVFNIGINAFKNSTLLKVLNNGDYTKVPTQMIRWVFVNKVIVDGLINRRTKEINLWNSSESYLPI